MKSELIKPVHLARKAVVYIRQSTPHQVVSNQESLRLQYALRQRARELGWHGDEFASRRRRQKDGTAIADISGKI